MIAVDKWNYNAWRQSLAFQLLCLNLTISPEQISLTATSNYYYVVFLEEKAEEHRG